MSLLTFRIDQWEEAAATPLEVVGESINPRVEREKMSPRVRVPTMADVAGIAGVSTATVSYILSGRGGGHDRISEETRSRVLQAVEGLGYVPDQTARIFRRRRTERVCLILPRLGVPGYDRIARDLQTVAQQNGYSVIIVVTGSAEREQEALDQLRRRLADGVAIVLPGHMNQADIEPLAEAGLAVVVWSEELEPCGFDVWRSWVAVGCAEAANYLVDQGHRRIAVLGPFADPIHLQRFRSWQGALESRGVTLDSKLIWDDNWSREGAYQAARAIGELGAPPTAILASTDIAAIGAMWAVRDIGLRVPEDVAIIGVGNIPEGEIIRPALTTVGPGQSDGLQLATILFGRLTSQVSQPGQVHGDPWRLIRRASA